MWIVYDIIFLIVALIHLPLYIFKRKFHPGFRMRLGLFPREFKMDSPVWIHAVSVGEAMAIKQLAAQLKEASNNRGLFITTVTSTGNKIAQSIAKDGDFVGYLPLDFNCIVKGVVKKVKPSLFIMAETEIWPNLISALYREKVPVILVNGRISDRSFRGYSAIRSFLKPVLDKITLFCVQADDDAKRLRSLGVPDEKIRVTGNMKFDNTALADKNAGGSDKYKAFLDLKADEKLWVCGSTHPGEEEIILDVYRELTREYPKLKLLIVPRHPERADEIERILSRYGFCAGLASKFPLKPCACVSRTVFILDMIGELMNYYNIADIVFVGGSLVRKGGHNILEPASAGKPVFIGPYFFNFRDIAGAFLKKDACVLVHDKEELLSRLKELLSNPDKSAALTERAREIISDNQGATSKNIACINTSLTPEVREVLKKENVKMGFRVTLFICAAAVLLSSAAPLRAEEESEDKKSPYWNVEIAGRHEPSRSAKAQTGEVEIFRTDYTFDYNLKAFGKLPVKLYLYNRHTGIDNTVTDVHLPSRLIDLATGIETTVPFFKLDKTYLRVAVEPSFYGDDWEFTSSEFRIPSYYYAIYLPNPKWTFICGVAVFPDTQTPVFPILGVIYKPNDRLTFHIAPKRPNITYKLTDKLSIFTEASFAFNNEYEVEYDDTRTAVLRYHESYAGGGIGYKPNEYIEATLSVGGNFKRRLAYNDSLGKINIKDGMYTQLRVTITP